MPEAFGGVFDLTKKVQKRGDDNSRVETNINDQGGGNNMPEPTQELETTLQDQPVQPHEPKKIYVYKLVPKGQNTLEEFENRLQRIKSKLEEYAGVIYGDIKRNLNEVPRRISYHEILTQRGKDRFIVVEFDDAIALDEEELKEKVISNLGLSDVAEIEDAQIHRTPDLTQIIGRTYLERAWKKYEEDIRRDEEKMRQQEQVPEAPQAPEEIQPQQTQTQQAPAPQPTQPPAQTQTQPQTTQTQQGPPRAGRTVDLYYAIRSNDFELSGEVIEKIASALGLSGTQGPNYRSLGIKSVAYSGTNAGMVVKLTVENADENKIRKINSFVGKHFGRSIRITDENVGEVLGEVDLNDIKFFEKLYAGEKKTLNLQQIRNEVRNRMANRVKVVAYEIGEDVSLRDVAEKLVEIYKKSKTPRDLGITRIEYLQNTGEGKKYVLIYADRNADESEIDSVFASEFGVPERIDPERMSYNIRAILTAEGIERRLPREMAKQEWTGEEQGERQEQVQQLRVYEVELGDYGIAALAEWARIFGRNIRYTEVEKRRLRRFWRKDRVRKYYIEAREDELKALKEMGIIKKYKESSAQNARALGDVSYEYKEKKFKVKVKQPNGGKRKITKSGALGGALGELTRAYQLMAEAVAEGKDSLMSWAIERSAGGFKPKMQNIFSYGKDKARRKLFEAYLHWRRAMEALRNANRQEIDGLLGELIAMNVYTLDDRNVAMLNGNGMRKLIEKNGAVGYALVTAAKMARADLGNEEVVRKEFANKLAWIYDGRIGEKNVYEYLLPRSRLRSAVKYILPGYTAGDFANAGLASSGYATYPATAAAINYLTTGGAPAAAASIGAGLGLILLSILGLWGIVKGAGKILNWVRRRNYTNPAQQA